MTEQTERTKRERRRRRSDDSEKQSRSGYAKSIQRAKQEDDAIVDTEWSPSGVWQPSGTTTDAEYDMADHHIQRALKGTGTSQDEVPDQVLDVVGNGGQALDYDLQRNLEDRMGADFSDVRIHTGGKAAEAADAIDAKAFTCGNDIVFNSGEYDPQSPEGQFLLAHELAHVKQQTDAPLSMMPQENADLEIDPDPQLERQADQAAKDALSGEEPLTVNRMSTEIHIQRKDWNSGPSNAQRLAGGDSQGIIEEQTENTKAAVREKFAELTKRTYRLTKEELAKLVENVDSAAELPAYIKANDIEASSKLADKLGSGTFGAKQGGKAGKAVGGHAAGTPGAVAGGLLGMPIGYIFSQAYGDVSAKEVEDKIRDLLNLNDNETFDIDEDDNAESQADDLGK